MPRAYYINSLKNHLSFDMGILKHLSLFLIKKITIEFPSFMIPLNPPLKKVELPLNPLLEKGEMKSDRG